MLTKTIYYLTIVIILISPLAYYSAGVGQQAHTLSSEPVVSAGGGLQNSPKAEALHSLTLPLRIERLLLYPLFLLLLQYSGAAVKLRARLETRWLPVIQQAPGFHTIDRRLRRLTWNRLSLEEAVIILLYLALFTLGITLLYLPFSGYSFVLRRQFDLSAQPLPAWLRDFCIGWGVNLVITLILYGGFYSLLRLIPQRWPIWVGLALTLFIFGYTLLEPVVITPLFYEISPLTDAALRERIEEMAGRAGVTIDDIFVIDASSKTNTVNAYFTGFGNASKIFLWDTLLTKHPPDEVDVVIAHEMGHWVHKHVFIGLMGGSAIAWLGLFALRWWLNRVWRKLGWRGPYDVAGYPYLLGVIALISLLTLPLVNSVSRYAENQADDFALTVSQKPEAAVVLFQRFARENLSPITVSSWEKAVFYTHPPLNERIEKAKSCQ